MDCMKSATPVEMDPNHYSFKINQIQEFSNEKKRQPLSFMIKKNNGYHKHYNDMESNNDQDIYK